MIAGALRAAFGGRDEQRGHMLGGGDDVNVSISGGAGSASGALVSVDRALTIPVVYGGIARIAESMRVMPMELIRQDQYGYHLPPYGMPLTQMICETPNEENSAGEMWELLVAWMLLRGNAYVWKERDRRSGRVIALWPIRPDRVYVTRDLRTRRKLFNLYANSDDPKPYATGTAHDFTHFRAFGTDPLRGIGVVEHQRELAGRTYAEEQYQGRALQNQVRPSGVLEAPEGFSDKAMQTLRSGWAQHAGTKGAGGTPILNDGVKWHGVAMTAADTQFIEQRQMTRQEWAIALRLPAGMLLAGEGGGLHYTSAAMDGQVYQTYTMLPWSLRIEDALRDDQDLPWGFTGLGDLPGRLYPRFNASAFTRADDLARAQSNAIGVKQGWLYTDEVRAREGLPVRTPPPAASDPNAPIEGGTDDASTQSA